MSQGTVTAIYRPINRAKTCFLHFLCIFVGLLSIYIFFLSCYCDCFKFLCKFSSSSVVFSDCAVDIVSPAYFHRCWFFDGKMTVIVVKLLVNSDNGGVQWYRQWFCWSVKNYVHWHRFFCLIWLRWRGSSGSGEGLCLLKLKAFWWRGEVETDKSFSVWSWVDYSSEWRQIVVESVTHFLLLIRVWQWQMVKRGSQVWNNDFYRDRNN